MAESIKVVVPWHNSQQLDAFLRAWQVADTDPRLLLVHDGCRAGCAATKNRGIQLALAAGVETVIILDDDCYPAAPGTLGDFIAAHERALQPVPNVTWVNVTDPPSRGTPYQLPATMPVAASMGFWTGIGDYDALAQLVRGATHPMTFDRMPIFGAYFPLCGMNLAFRPKEWLPWCQFIDVPRFDDIWMGWLWQKEAYRRGACFNLTGPLVQHARQSNVWANLREEVKYLESNETLWQKIARAPTFDYKKLRQLLPVA